MRLVTFILANLRLALTAFAHGISDADRAGILEGGNFEYLKLGATHILSGYDHLLFLFGVMIPATVDEIWKAIHSQEVKLAKVVAAKDSGEAHDHAFAIRDLVKARPAKVAAGNKTKAEESSKEIAKLAADIDKSGAAGAQKATEENGKKLGAAIKALQTKLKPVEGEKDGQSRRARGRRIWGITALVSLHDIMEAIIGELPTPEDRSRPRAIRRNDGSWLVDGILEVKEFERAVLDFPLPSAAQRDYQTIAGFIVKHLGHVPKEGETFSLHGYLVEVIDMDGHRVDKLLLMPVKARPTPATSRSSPSTTPK